VVPCGPCLHWRLLLCGARGLWPLAVGACSAEVFSHGGQDFRRNYRVTPTTRIIQPMPYQFLQLSVTSADLRTFYPLLPLRQVAPNASAMKCVSLMQCFLDAKSLEHSALGLIRSNPWPSACP